jgi:asparagine synthase (glutamine-hydrolysing)|tara:strand:+ start:116 stop:655 length:540 start_codon:yes stop_codon:yes gene_type:complete
MCGIVGIWSQRGFTEDKLRSLTVSACDAIRLRGPDHRGTWNNPDEGISLGHQRLSILDLSAAGNQPMFSENGRYIMVYNGEIYNHHILREALNAKGHTRAKGWIGRSDTETLLQAIQIYGFEQALKMSDGMFALAVWDRTERKLMLARDRIGEKPLYYGWMQGCFVFGSELKAMKAIIP